MMYKRYIVSKRIITIVFVLCLMAYFILYSAECMDAVRIGVSLYLTSVLPSMLPFFFFSKLLTELDFASDIAKVTSKPLSFLFGSPPVGGYILIMSLLCGYPVGAKLISEFYLNGFIDEKQAKSISSYSSTGGPLFIIGTIGVAMFQNKKYGILLLVSHYLGTFINGIIYREKQKDIAPSLPKGRVGGNLLESTIKNTVYSVGIVGCYIILFTLFAQVAVSLGIVPFFSAVLSSIGIPSRLSYGFLVGLIEMTNGVKILSESSLPPLLLLPVCEFIITFGGCSVTLQSLSFLSKTKISPAFYLLQKATQGILSSFVLYLLLLIVL